MKSVTAKSVSILMTTVFAALLLSACSSKVIVNKESCKEIYGGTLMECEQVKK